MCSISPGALKANRVHLAPVDPQMVVDQPLALRPQYGLDLALLDGLVVVVETTQTAKTGPYPGYQVPTAVCLAKKWQWWILIQFQI